jgi:hypothetical protein
MLNIDKIVTNNKGRPSSTRKNKKNTHYNTLSSSLIRPHDLSPISLNINR